ncbi:c-type cytochrome [Flavobacterium sp. xlx-214]|uniref:c-type cytochrome n=1 Tax=unclassified Flavobacterium TaxID=196869 RepID=UPI0013D145B2|nr:MULTISPECIES: c-type cytochrome [unclassified Flavobacterium]MBA5791957.1 c-type cytochrome [Flavobacterium sp. xlx-221]QMI84212.1 c-type cytochrome [Flavobacterium sp. xlx-214]
MKKIFALAIVALTVISCGKKEEKKEELYPEEVASTLSPEEQLIADGKELFESNKAACFSCHQMDKKVIGPSIKDIAKIYKEKNGDMVAFLRKKADPIVDPSQYSLMETNFAVLKTMSDDELKSLQAYMMSSIK